MISLLLCLMMTLAALSIGGVVQAVCCPRREGESPRSAAEWLGVDIAVGYGVLSAIVLGMSFLGHRPTQGMAIGIEGIAILLGVGLVFRERKTLTALRWKSPLPTESLDRTLAAVGMVLVGYCLWQAAILALSTGIIEWDGFAIWGLKAKVMSLEALMPRPSYFSELGMSYSHLRYPLGVPALIAFTYATLGAIDDRWGKFFFVVQYLGLVCIAFAIARRRLGSGASWMLAGVVAANPALLHFGTSGTADLSVTLYQATAVLCIVRWAERERLGDLLLAGICSGSAILTKNEGVAMTCACAAAVGVHALTGNRRPRLIAAGGYVVAVLMIAGPWLVWSRGIPNTDENYAGQAARGILPAIGRLPEVLKLTAGWLVRYYDVSFLPLALPVMALLTLNAFRDPGTRTLWIIFGLNALAYLAIYAITPWNLSELMDYTFPRLIMHLTPLMAACFAFHLGNANEMRNTNRLP